MEGLKQLIKILSREKSNSFSLYAIADGIWNTTFYPIVFTNICSYLADFGTSVVYFYNSIVWFNS